MKFFCGYCEMAGRAGDLHVTRNNGEWFINAGVNALGHDPGFGVYHHIADGAAESKNFDAFLKETAHVQKFIMNELGATQTTCDKIFVQIWDYIQQDAD